MRNSVSKDLPNFSQIMTEKIKMMEFYNTVRQLGKGTFGTVQLCERIHNKQKIVVKQIVTELEGQQLEAAKNEVVILKSLNHPNVIQYYDSYIQKGLFYIVMEYASKGTLQESIERERPKYFTPQHVMDLFCQILMGLDHIHRRKVIHRDLKTENLFLTGLKADVIKIGDFGISKNLVNGKMANTVIGTCNYLAPELCDGKPYNSKSDIWSLGCILYEMCAMQKMFDGTVSNIVLSIANGRKKTVNTKVYGKQMQEIIDMMLQPRPEDRPDTLALMTHPDIFPSLYYLGSYLGCIE
ncbi:serine/threonine-protein kinase Nek8 [Leptinotarsa decemlineata]|uniref:serine/threonine-protein kinase Nek8 n=1 Tax=Leptinotarsa decemlineata TaxID=7539 RepID=UPI003D30691B